MGNKSLDFMVTLFVPYNSALKFKELGFDEPCLTFFWDDGEIYPGVELPQNFNNNITQISAPLYQQAINWIKCKDILISELWNGWEYGSYGCDNFIYSDNINNVINESLKLIEEKGF